jgi:bifunctional enzyme CysN/CysC
VSKPPVARGGTILLTGLSGAGKSTLAGVLAERLRERDRHAYILDGDRLRTGLSRDLGYTEADRSEHLRRVGYVACVLADAGLIAVLAVIAPLGADRQRLRAIHQEAELPFLEVFLDTSLAECERRDPKGLYARARRGELPNFTGIDSPYQPPEAPEVRLSGPWTPAEGAERVLGCLPPSLARG